MGINIDPTAQARVPKGTDEFWTSQGLNVEESKKKLTFSYLPVPRDASLVKKVLEAMMMAGTEVSDQIIEDKIENSGSIKTEGVASKIASILREALAIRIKELGKDLYSRADQNEAVRLLSGLPFPVVAKAETKVKTSSDSVDLS